ncbi:MAG: GNAT family N-acetyltransferase [Betaproteobacteria bacterium]|nr:GNAT family N-acetyltransferase [Betaproteobacteria bacterium]
MSAQPDSLREHALEESHVPQCLALSEEAGWNQIEADWRLMLRLGQGLGISTQDGRLVATTIMLPYERCFAWISMVLVTERFRRRGLATRLMRRAIDELVAGGYVPLLDATPAGREVYQRLGFEDCWGMARLASAAAIVPDGPTPGTGPRVLRLASGDWTSVLEFDRAVFGADRAGILRDLAGRVPHAALVAERDGRFCGASFARDGRRATQLGPVIAVDESAALALLAAALTAIAGPVFIDVPERHATIDAWLRDLGFALQRPLLRMAFGRNRAFDDSSRLYAVAGPELG